MTLPFLLLLGVAAVALMVAALFAALWLGARRREREARHRAERAAGARDAFFDIATHELRSPLAAILGYQELLHDGAYGTVSDNAAEPVLRIGRSARHLLHLIDGVVELGRLRGGGVHPEIEPVNTGVLVSGISDAFRLHARDRGLEAAVDLHGPLPVIRSDPDRLLRALDLFITSAVKHPAERELHMDVSSDGHDLRVRIHPVEIAPHDPTHGDDPELRLGIRLAIAGRVAELLGGGLALEAGGDEVVRALELRVRDLAGDGRP